MSEKLFDWVMAGADLQSESAPGTTLVEIFGVKRILIENHRGVTSYSRSDICIRTTYGLLSVSGEDLSLASMSKQQLIVTGCIACVSLCKEHT